MNQKQEGLQTLLDTAKLCTDLFDEIEAETFRPNRAVIHRVFRLSEELAALHQRLMLDYVLSGDAGEDMMQGMKEDLQRARDQRGPRT